MKSASQKRFATLFLSTALLLPPLGTLLAQQAARETYSTAREHLIDERLEQALVMFQKVVTDYPGSEEADDAQYYVGYTLEQLDRDPAAIEAYGELLRNWPDSIRAERARENRAELLGRRPGENREMLEEVFSGNTSWELKRDTASSLARSGNLTAADILEEAMRRESSSRRLELVKILESQTSNPEARRVLIVGLEPAASSSVQLRALQALAPVASEPEVAAAFGHTLSQSTSSSVKLKAIQILSSYVGHENTRRAIAASLDLDNSSSVQIAACQALKGHLLEPEIRPSVVRLFEGSASTSVLLKALESLEPDKDTVEAAELLRPAIVNRNSTSVQLKAIDIAARSSHPQVRAVARGGLVPGYSTSVQLKAVKAFGEGRPNDAAAAEALGEMFRYEGISTSVQIAGLDVLAQHMNAPAAPGALAAALNPGRSTSVQLKAMRLAVRHLEHPEVRRSIIRLLDDSSTSTSVQLEAVKLMGTDAGEVEVRRVIGAALRPSNSTSVHLRAVEALSSQVDHEDVRQALTETLDDEYSTSVILQSMEALVGFVDRDPGVKRRFIRLMLDEEISSTARVRAGQALVDGADARLERQIAEAMEDVFLRLTRRGRRGHNDLIDDALDVLRAVDPERAERLSGRRGAVRSKQNRNASLVDKVEVEVASAWDQLRNCQEWVSFLARLMWVAPQSPRQKESVAVWIAAGGAEVQASTPLWRLAARPSY